MKIKSGCQIELACSTDTDRKPLLQPRLDVEHKVAIATNGQMMAVVPVEVGENDISGGIPGATLAALRQTHAGKRVEKVFVIGEGWVKRKAGVCDLQLTDKSTSEVGVHERPDTGDYNWKVVIPKGVMEYTNKAKVRFAVNPTLLLQLAKAIGSPHCITQLSGLQHLPEQKLAPSV